MKLALHHILLSSAIIASSAFVPSTVTQPRHRISFSLNVSPKPLQAATLSIDETKEEIRDASETEKPTEVTERRKTVLDDGFIFGLENSGLERPKGKQALLVIEDDSLETKPYQVAIVATTLTAHSLLSLNSISDILAQQNGDVLSTATIAGSVLLSSWLLADLGSGIFHWSVDNYGNGKTPLLGSIIAAFQGHHTAPWTITQRGFCNNTYKLCTPFGIPTMLAIHALTGPATTLFFAAFCTLEIMSQEFHKWSHTTKKQGPQWVNTLQDAGVTVARKQHALHHMAPYDGNYCIVSGAWNEMLDKSGFFRRLEKIIYDWNGVESNAWKLDPELRARTLRGEYTPNKQ